MPLSVPVLTPWHRKSAAHSPHEALTRRKPAYSIHSTSMPAAFALAMGPCHPVLSRYPHACSPCKRALHGRKDQDQDQDQTQTQDEPAGALRHSQRVPPSSPKPNGKCVVMTQSPEKQDGFATLGGKMASLLLTASANGRGSCASSTYNSSTNSSKPKY